jgi:hypothetical protein
MRAIRDRPEVVDSATWRLHNWSARRSGRIGTRRCGASRRAPTPRIIPAHNSRNRRRREQQRGSQRSNQAEVGGRRSEGRRSDSAPPSAFLLPLSEVSIKTPADVAPSFAPVIAVLANGRKPRAVSLSTLAPFALVGRSGGRREEADRCTVGSIIPIAPRFR